MSSRKTLTDLLFGVQITGAVLFCVPQILRSLTNVHGVSGVQFGLVAAFAALNLLLASDAYKASATRPAVQLVITYVIWLFFSLCMVGAVITNPSYHWSVQESVMLVVAGISTACVALIARCKRLAITDSMIKACLAIAYKAIPQVLLVWKIATDGGSGIPALTIIIGHATIAIRLAQIHYMNKGRARSWLTVSESANEATWILVTIAWIVFS